MRKYINPETQLRMFAITFSFMGVILLVGGIILGCTNLTLSLPNFDNEKVSVFMAIIGIIYIICGAILHGSSGCKNK